MLWPTAEDVVCLEREFAWAEGDGNTNVKHRCVVGEEIIISSDDRMPDKKDAWGRYYRDHQRWVQLSK
jgi:hypothetical protein